MELEAAEVFRRTSLIESMLAQLEVMVAQKLASEEEEGASMPDRELEFEGEFGLVFPGYAYRVLVEPTEVDMLNRVTIELSQAEFDKETGALLEEPEPVYVVRTLRATPPMINLDSEENGVSLTVDQRSSLQGLGLIDDDGNFNIQKLVAMDPAALLELLPVLMSAFGGGQLAQMMGGMSPEQLLEALEQQQLASAGEGAGEEVAGGPETGEEGARPGSGDGVDEAPTFDEINPSGGLTQEQFEWMLEQLRKKDRQRQ
ncbi:MAG: hypothetical protein JSU68_09990, partial [Phycisphaerales bacterium]